MLPKLEDLFSDSNPVVKAFLGRLKDPYGFWYPAYQDGTVRPMLVQTLFQIFQRKLGGDELNGLMPPMRTQPVRGTDPVMMLRAYDQAVHGPLEIKDDALFRVRRASFATTHPDLRGFGTIHFYGGFESNFDKSSLIRGPLYAGSHCTIRSSAKVIGPAVLGDRTLLNTSSVLTRTILGSGSQIDDLVSVKDSIIGKNVYIMTGAKLLHRESIESQSVEVMDRRVSTNSNRLKALAKRHKIGAIIGDGCEIGANAVLGPGTILMPGVKVPHGLYVPSGVYDKWGIINLQREKTHY